MFLVEPYDVFTPGPIDLVTQPLAAQHGEVYHNEAQGRGVDSFIILTYETHVSEHTLIHTQSSDHQGLTGVAPHDEVKKGRGLIENSVRDVNCALCIFLWKIL